MSSSIWMLLFQSHVEACKPEKIQKKMKHEICVLYMSLCFDGPENAVVLFLQPKCPYLMN